MLFLICLFLANSIVPQGEPSLPKEPFRIVIKETTGLVKSGSPAVVTVHLTNSSKQELDASGNWSDLTGTDPGWQFDVRDDSGKPVARRVYNHQELAFGKVIFRGVPPGGSIVDDVDVTRLFDLRKPGKYRIQVSREIPKKNGGGTIKSNVVNITVTN